MCLLQAISDIFSVGFRSRVHTESLKTYMVAGPDILYQCWSCCSGNY